MIPRVFWFALLLLVNIFSYCECKIFAGWYGFQSKAYMSCREQVPDAVDGHSKLLDDRDFSFYQGEYEGVFQNATFVDLYGSECRLPYLPQKFLGSFKLVERFHLSFIGTASIKSEDFRENINLNYLSVSNNNLIELPAFLLEHTPLVESFVCTNNQIRTVNRDTFSVNVENLKYLMLDMNRIESLDKDLVKNASGLDVLDLSDNLLTTFSLDLRNAEKLTYLALYNNKITQLDSDLFKYTLNLKKLDLWNNLLEIFAPDMQNAVKINSLNLRKNRIRQLDCNVFPINRNSTNYFDIEVSNNGLHKIGDFDCRNYTKSFVHIDHNMERKVTVLSIPSLIQTCGYSIQITEFMPSKDPSKIAHLFGLNSKDCFSPID